MFNYLPLFKLYTTESKATLVTMETLSAGAYIYPTLLPQAGYDTRSIFQQSKAEFSFSKTGCLTKIKGLSLPGYFLHSSGKNRFMPFPMRLAQSEMQTASSRFWTCISNSISFDENCYVEHVSHQQGELVFNLVFK